MDLAERSTTLTQRHPWELTRFDFFSRELRAMLNGKLPRAVLDIGSGDAWFAERLCAELPVGCRLTCWDSGYAAQPAFLTSKTWPPLLSFVSEPPRERFDAVLMLDVLEHIENDREFLSDVVTRQLSGDGWLLMSVPAWPSLFSAHDVKLKHFRRYTPGQARALLETAGLEIVRSGGLFHLLLAARLASVAVARYRKPPLDQAAEVADWRAGAVLTQGVLLALAMDGALSRLFTMLRCNIPGLSWWALCRKRH